jgi:hypothetical protein
LTTVSLGFSHSEDEIFPTDAEIFNRIINDDKQSSSVFVSVSQIINQLSTFQSAISITEQTGFLSDPYKLRDVRPEDKKQFAWSNSYRRFFVDADAAWHTNYRYYHDDFGINSHTADMSWHQNVGKSLQIVPHLRYYSQSSADFFTNIDNPLNPLTEYQSSDYRLSAFGAISGGINFILELDKWIVTLSTERYIAKEKYSAYKVSQPSTALVKYNRVSLGFDYSF